MSDLVTHCFDAWGVTLIMPRTMSLEDMDDIMIMTNGCGREGAENRFVPDSILGLDISPACRVHDWMYADAQAETDEPAALAAEIEADKLAASELEVEAEHAEQAVEGIEEQVEAAGKDVEGAASEVNQTVDDITPESNSLPETDQKLEDDISSFPND